MDNEFNKILEQIAKKHGTTPERIYSSIEDAIEEAFASDDPTVKENLKDIGIDSSCDPEMFMKAIANEASKRMR